MRAILFLNKIFLIFLLSSCSNKNIYNYSTVPLLSLAAPTDKVAGLRRQRDVARDFLCDIGGVPIEGNYMDGEAIDGFYFDPLLFKKSEFTAYKKWRLLFNNPKNARLAQIFDIDLQGTSLATLFHLPNYLRPMKELKGKPLGVICFPAMGIVYELDPQMILTFLLRGYHVAVVNYRGILPTREEVRFEALSKDACILHNWLQNKVQLAKEHILCYGKSFGSALAISASLAKKSPLLIDRGFAQLSRVCKRDGFLSAFAQQMLEKNYRFPNEEWIRNVESPVLILEALGDTKMRGEGEKLLAAYAKDSATLVKVAGSHFGIYWGDPLPTWYSDEKSQEKVDKFLKKIFQ